MRPTGRPVQLLFAVVACVPSAVLAAGDLGATSVEPAELRLIGAEARVQLVVSRAEGDGTAADLTTRAVFAVEPPTIAAVTSSGVVLPRADGTGTVRITVDERTVDRPLVVAHAAAPNPVSFRLDVAPLLSRSGCNMGTCHGNFNGKGGLKLSLRGDDPSLDFLALTRDAFGRRVNRSHPEESLIVLKPAGRQPHEGGVRFAADSIDAALLTRWVAGGLHDDIATGPRVTRLAVYPVERIFDAANRSQQLRVTAELSDGTSRDVTRFAAYDVSEPAKLAVTVDGLVRASGPIEGVVSVRYAGSRAASRLAFLPERRGFAWTDVPERNDVDRLVFKKLRSHRIHPSGPSADTVFVRRAYLDGIGRLPTVEEARRFIADGDPEKRDRLIDALVAKPEFADFWALKWADLLRNEEKVMGPKGVWVFQRWLRDRIDSDDGLDRIVRDVLAARGSTWRNPASAFHRTNRDPETAAEAVGQVFLGVRLQCARCHNHPFDSWTQDDYYGLAAYFSNLDRKQIANQRTDQFDKHEITGDEVVFLSGKPRMKQPRTGEMMDPKPPGGPRPELCNDADALDDLAEWLTRDNPQFARNTANRVWYHLMGRGIVDPVDDFRDSNPPSNPELLELLAHRFAADGYRLRPLVAFIMKSRTYGLDSRPTPTNADDEVDFSHAAIRPLPAEVLMDALGQALERPENFPAAPAGARAVQLPGTRSGTTFLKTFGKPDRLLTCECERSDTVTLSQAFQLINGSVVRDRIEARNNRIGRLLVAGAPDGSILDELYLAALSREPTVVEREGILAHIGKASDRRKGWEDVAWALVNSKEFLLRH